MRGFALGLSLSIAFILGCVAAPLIVPPLSAQQQAAGVQRWEYTCPSLNAHRAEADLNELGAQGWELVGSWGTGWAVCLKRPL